MIESLMPAFSLLNQPALGFVASLGRRSAATGMHEFKDLIFIQF
jgi:hypothetical protein